jgi:ribonuclease BN (tRNA processing enzyme)
MPLYLPEGLWECMRCLLSERGAAEFAEAFVPMTLEERVPVLVGDLVVTPYLVEHTEPTFALVAEADGAKLVYSADTAPCGGIRDAARNADLLLAEATLPEEYSGAAPHMTSSEAGALAREAGVRALALAHIWPTNDRDLMARLASEAFGAPVVVTNEFDEFEIAPEGGKDD